MNSIHIMVMLSSLLIGNCIFFATYLLWGNQLRKGQVFLKRVLGFLLLAFALRIVKSLVYIVFPEFAPGLTKIGIIGMLAIGPLFWVYIKFMGGDSRRIWMHMIPCVLFIMLFPIIQDRSIHPVYILSLFHMFTYLILSLDHLRRRLFLDSEALGSSKKWLIQFTLALFFIWTGFLLQAFVYDAGWYIGITAMEVVIFFTICFIGMMQVDKISKPFTPHAKSSEELFHLANTANCILDTEKLYLNSNLTLDVLAKKMGTSRHELSNAINNALKRSFPELLNEVRINHSKNILLQDKNRSMSIETIAYESGFNSLSTFYKNFKKNTGITPAEFREQIIG